MTFSRFKLKNKKVAIFSLTDKTTIKIFMAGY